MRKENPLTSPVLLFFFGLTLYLGNAWVPGMFFDGHLYMALGKHAAELGYWLIPHLSKSTHPEFSLHLPFVFILEGLFFKLFGSSYTTGRIFSALFSIGCFIILYLWTRKKSEAQAFWSCFFFLIIPPLIKKTRVPGLDTPLMFFCLLCAWLTFCYLEEKRLKWAISAGLAWGCALLTKGPIAFFVPCGVLFYLAISRQKDVFFDFKTWLIPVAGLALFSIWPVGLWMMGKSEIAQKYFVSVFIDTALKGRGVPYNDFFFYIFYFAKQTFFIFPLALAGIWVAWRQKCPLGKYACALFLALIIPMSMMSFKYSHYIIPGYPYLALLAGMGITSYASETWLQQFERKVFPILALVLFSLLSIFPITNRSNRDPQLQRMASLTEGLQRPPRQWALVNQAYPFYHAANFMAWRYSAEVFDANEAIFQKILDEEDVSHLVESEWPQELNPHEWALLVKSEDWKKEHNCVTIHVPTKNHDKSRVTVHNLGQDLRGKQTGATEAYEKYVAGSDSAADSQKGLSCEQLHNFKVIAHFKKGDFLFVVHKSLLKEPFLHFQ